MLNTSRATFGVQITPLADDVHRAVALATQADEESLDLVGMQDHPYSTRLADAMTTVGAALAATRRVHVFPDVANLPLRPAPMLAKAAATLDRLSHGRLELGLGAGAQLDAVVAMGGPRLTPSRALHHLELGVRSLRAAWASGDATAPAHRIEIWLGMVGRLGLQALGRVADGWAAPIPSYLPYDRWEWANRVIDDAAEQAHRDPRSIRRIAQVVGTITDRPMLPFSPAGSAPVRDTPDGWLRAISHILDDLRFDAIVFWPEVLTSAQLSRFAAVAHEAADLAGLQQRRGPAPPSRSGTSTVPTAR